MMEEWRAVPGYEGLYEVSNKGNVRNVRRNTLLRLSKDCYGYIQVSLYKNGRRTGLRVHRLVTEAFLPNPDNLPEVNHKDEDKTNNRVENLEWCDHKYNMNYGTRNIRAKETAIKNGYWSSLSKEEKEERRKENSKKCYQEKKKLSKEEKEERKKEYLHKYYQDHKEERRLYMRDYQRKHKKK